MPTSPTSPFSQIAKGAMAGRYIFMLLTMHQAQAGALVKFANQLALSEIGRMAKAFYAAGCSVREPIWGQRGTHLEPAHSSNFALNIRPHSKFKLSCDFHLKNWLLCGISRRSRQQRQSRRRALLSLVHGLTRTERVQACSSLSSLLPSVFNGPRAGDG
jgi:hypothetical protein